MEGPQSLGKEPLQTDRIRSTGLNNVGDSFSVEDRGALIAHTVPVIISPLVGRVWWGILKGPVAVELGLELLNLGDHI